MIQMSSFRHDVNKLREATAQQGHIRQALRDRDETIRGEERGGCRRGEFLSLCWGQVFADLGAIKDCFSSRNTTMRVGRNCMQRQAFSMPLLFLQVDHPRGLCTHRQ